MYAFSAIMSESDTSSQSPRKSEPEISSLRGAVPKRKPFRRSTKKVVKRPETPYEFYQADALSDVLIKVMVFSKTCVKLLLKNRQKKSY